MSSFQFEIQLGVINAGGAGGGTGTVTDLKTIPVVGGGSKAVFERNIMVVADRKTFGHFFIFEKL